MGRINWANVWSTWHAGTGCREEQRDACCRGDGTVDIARVAVAILKRSVQEVDARGMQQPWTKMHGTSCNASTLFQTSNVNENT